MVHSWLCRALSHPLECLQKSRDGGGSLEDCAAGCPTVVSRHAERWGLHPSICLQALTAHSTSRASATREQEENSATLRGKCRFADDEARQPLASAVLFGFADGKEERLYQRHITSARFDLALVHPRRPLQLCRPLFSSLRGWQQGAWRNSDWVAYQWALLAVWLACWLTGMRPSPMAAVCMVRGRMPGAHAPGMAGEQPHWRPDLLRPQRRALLEEGARMGGCVHRLRRLGHSAGAAG